MADARKCDTRDNTKIDGTDHMNRTEHDAKDRVETMRAYESFEPWFNNRHALEAL